ncbi:hypothetical protein CMI37_35605, partial [Candidatus Pacearchaeota archaeon]|nr:hypothetical protein [Candidatus Pacearchaeota archaeon]
MADKPLSALALEKLLEVEEKRKKSAPAPAALQPATPNAPPAQQSALALKKMLEVNAEKEKRSREAELASQPLPPLDLPTEEDRESRADIESAAEWYGGVKRREEEERESKHRESQLKFVGEYLGLERRRSDINE